MNSEVRAPPSARASETHILLVEDEVLVRMLIAEELRDNGYCVLEAANYDEALALLCSMESIDLVLTDVKMPGTFDGLDLARVVRQGWPEVKLVVSSGHLLSSDIARASIDAFLPKPYPLSALLRVMQQIIPRGNTSEA
jgi:CheY-like chemotaxis protein